MVGFPSRKLQKRLILPRVRGHDYPAAAGEPDWQEVAARAERIFADALDPVAIAAATPDELADAVLAVAKEEAEAVAGLELFARALKVPSPSLSHGIGQRARRVQLMIAAAERLRAMAQ
jgi:hypothetical protein